MATTERESFRVQALSSSDAPRRMRLVDRLGAAMIQHPVATLFGLWLIHLAYLGALQAADLSYGFAVWPMGEDRNWLRFMLDAPGVAMVREFWQMNDRNPLSPWWYWLFSKPILNLDWGLYAVRKFVDVFLAIVVTLLFRRLFRNPRHPLPLLLGMLVLVCNFSGYREQIIWNFLTASGLGLVALHLYARFVDTGRVAPYCLAAALIAFLVAIATYTLNLGMLIAVAAIALLRRPWGGDEPKWAARARDGILEIAFFVTVAGVFMLIWYTAARPSSDYYRLNVGLAAQQFASSVRQLLWHPDFTYYIVNAYRSPEVVFASLPFAALLIAGVLAVAFNKRASWKMTAGQLGWFSVVLAALAATIVTLESTSKVWLPGTRSMMIYQLSAPLLMLLLTGAVALALQSQGRAIAARAWIVLTISVALLSIVPASMLYNQILVKKTDAQRRFSVQLARLADERDDIRAFVVRYADDPDLTWGSDVMSDTYARTILRRRDVTMRFLQRRPAPHVEWAHWWQVQLGPDHEGVRNTSHVNAEPVSYSSVRFLDWDGTTLSVPVSIDRQWFTGLEADWRRETSIAQAARHAPTCPVHFDFATSPLRGEGWSVPERHPAGGFGMWMGATRASMVLRTACAGSVSITLGVSGYMAEDILTGLTLRVDGEPVPLEINRSAEGVYLTGRMELPAGDKRIRLDLEAPRVMVPQGGNRTLAVMFRRLTLQPLKPL